MIVDELQAEKLSQFPAETPSNHPLVWLALVTSQLGRAAKLMVDAQKDLVPRSKSATLYAAREELLQTAALMLAAIESIDSAISTKKEMQQ